MRVTTRAATQEREQPEYQFPMKVPCSGCLQTIDVANLQELEDLALGKSHRCYVGRVDPKAEQARYDEGYAKGFAAGYEAGRKGAV